MNEFLKLVTQRPDKKLWKKGNFCPSCGSKSIATFGTRTTLVGYSGEDMNHTWTECQCNECSEYFTRETKGKKNVWFTDQNHKVLLGIPYCFEGYIYTCKYCGGDVIRTYFDVVTDKETEKHEIGGMQVRILSTEVKEGKSTPKQYPVFRCKQCGTEIKSENDHIYAK